MPYEHMEETCLFWTQTIYNTCINKGPLQLTSHVTSG